MSTQKITVLGAGNIGSTLGRKWITTGHQVAFGVSDPNGVKAQTLGGELGENAAEIGTVAQANSTNPDVVLMAIPGTAMDDVISQYADQLDGKIIIDATNKRGASIYNSFAALQQHTPHAHLYRAFNTYGWENFAHPDYEMGPADLFFCGTEGDSRMVVEQLISDIGLRPIYLGGVEQVSLVDSVFELWIALTAGQHKGRRLVFKVLTQ